MFTSQKQKHEDFQARQGEGRGTEQKLYFKTNKYRCEEKSRLVEGKLKLILKVIKDQEKNECKGKA